MRGIQDNDQRGNVFLFALVVLIALIGVGVASFLVYQRKPRLSGEVIKTNFPGKGVKQYCNSLENYCLSYPETWMVSEQQQQAQDHKGKTTTTSIATLTALNGTSLKIVPQFGGGPGGGKCFTERIQYNPDSECLIETYVSSRAVTGDSFCNEIKSVHIIHKEIHTPSKPTPRYQLRFGSMREHDVFSTPISMNKEFLSNGYDYDNNITHCKRLGENQPRFGTLRFDINAEGNSEDFFKEPATLETESILESFRFQ